MSKMHGENVWHLFIAEQYTFLIVNYYPQVGTVLSTM